MATCRDMSAARATKALLTARTFTKVPSRGKALEGWVRPSINEMTVPTESWAKVRPATYRREANPSAHLPLPQVNSAKQTKFLLQLGLGLAVMGGTAFKLYTDVFSATKTCNKTPHHLMQN